MSRAVRRLVLTGLIFLLLIGVTAFAPTAAFAESLAEKEPNNFLHTAAAIKVNAQVTGALSSSSDDDWYRFTLPSSGKVNITFKHGAVNSLSIFWGVDLYWYDPGSGEKTLLTEIDSAGSKPSITGSSVGLPSGTYYLFVNAGERHSSIPYTIVASFTAASTWEKEYNNSLQTATTAKVNTAYSGSLMRSSDDDWYRFTVSSAGKVNITFRHGAVNLAGTCWKIGLYRYNPVSGARMLLTQIDSAGGDLSLTSSSVGLPAGTYYVMVDVGGLYSGITYTVTASFTASSQWERESNDSLQTANAIKLDTACYGSLMRSADSDWYRLTLSSPRVISMGFTHKAIDSKDKYWSINLYSYNTVTGKRSESPVLHMESSGNTTSVRSGSRNLPEGTYYVNVNRYNHSSVAYSLTISWLLDQPSVNAVSASYDSIKLSWPAVSGAAGYEVYRSLSKTGTYAKLTTTTARSYQNTGLITGVTYYYKVRAYRTSGDRAVYSAYSPIVSAQPTLPAPSGFSAARASKSSIRLSWAAVPGASGHEVFRYHSSTGTYQMIAKVGSSVIGYVDIGLIRYKVYSYKVRAYRMIGQTLVYGPFSPVKSAKPY